jgi:hypothetical protein
MPEAVLLAPVALTTKPLVKEPESLLLKVVQSPAWSWPVFTMEAKGRLMVRELVEVEMLKIEPAVPVVTELMTLAEREMEVEVPMSTCNLTITSSTALTVIGGSVSSTTNAIGLYVTAPTGATTNNFAAILLGGSVGIGSSTPTAVLAVQGTPSSVTDLFSVASSTGVAQLKVASNGSTTIASLGAGNVRSTATGGLFIGGVNLAGGAAEITGVLGVANGGLGTTTLGNLTVSSSNLSITGGQQVLIGTSTQITLTNTPTFTTLTVTGTTTLQSATTSINGVSYFWPSALPPTNRILQSDSSGNLTWVTD